MKILLLNPPGKRHYSRDYFCCKVVKCRYTEHPIDFLILAGILGQKHSIAILDAIVQHLSPAETLRRIHQVAPDVIIFLSGTASFHEDLIFFESLKQDSPAVRLIGLGDIFLEDETLRRYPFIEAAIRDFTSSEILDYLDGQRSPTKLRSVRFRENGDILAGGVPASISKSNIPKEFSIPVPRHDLFLRKGYRFPFALYHPYATILTDFGCPFSCKFCIYGSLIYRRRPVENVVEELRFLHGLGVRELFIKDQCFGAEPTRAMAICDALAREGPFSWSCFLRADLAKAELLQLMRQAGCHLIMFGVETANLDILTEYRKGMVPQDNERAFRLCREAGIDTMGIFILGFPGETEASCRATIDLALRLDADYASFNIFVPKPATEIRHELEATGKLKVEPTQILDQSGLAATWTSGTLPADLLQKLREEAMCRFYARPSYIWKRLLHVRTLYECEMLVGSALGIVQDLVAARAARNRADSHFH